VRVLNSMTGYGRGEASNADVTVVVELKSVNNRFRDLQLRCPREYMMLEPQMHKLLKAPFQRGRIDAFVRRQARASSKRVHANTELANEYAQVLNDVAADMVGYVGKDVPFTFISKKRFPIIHLTSFVPVDSSGGASGDIQYFSE